MTADAAFLARRRDLPRDRPGPAAERRTLARARSAAPGGSASALFAAAQQ